MKKKEFLFYFWVLDSVKRAVLGLSETGHMARVRVLVKRVVRLACSVDFSESLLTFLLEFDFVLYYLF